MRHIPREKKRKAKRSLKKILETIEPYLPPKPKAPARVCEDWELAKTSTLESRPAGGIERPKHHKAV